MCVSIGDSHRTSVVTLDSHWGGEFIFGVRVLNALHQPFGKPLLEDGLTLALSAIGNKELGSALLLEIACPPYILV